jgi:hypothetical protein
MRYLHRLQNPFMGTHFHSDYAWKNKQENILKDSSLLTARWGRELGSPFCSLFLSASFTLVRERYFFFN